MGQPKRSVQIRDLKNPNDKKLASLQDRKSAAYSVLGFAAVMVAMVAMWEPKDRDVSPKTKPNPSTQVDDSSPEGKVNKYLQEAQAKRNMEMRARDVENKIFAKPIEGGAQITEESDSNAQRPLGVSMDHEVMDEKVYNDLYADRHPHKATPEDKIESRIEQEQWMSTMEIQDRKAFVQSFINQAAEAGYAIELDENLVVIRVRKIKAHPQQTLDQVLEGLARKGF